MPSDLVRYLSDSNPPSSNPSVVSISYSTLVSSPLALENAIGKSRRLSRFLHSYWRSDLSAVKSVEQAFGSHPRALGIILVEGLPDIYKCYRETLLKLGHRYAHLPEDVKERYTDPESSYRCGFMALLISPT